MADFLSQTQTNKLQLIGEIKQKLAPLQFKPPDPRRWTSRN